jgi:RNA 3'-phosphate cyclase
MPDPIRVEITPGAGGGFVLRTALALSAGTGQAFAAAEVRGRGLRSGLDAHQVAAIRAASLACGARVRGGFEGSQDLLFEPGPVAGGDFRFEIATAGAATLVLQTVLAPLATASETSHVDVTGGTHVPGSPSFDYLARHWTAVLERLGLRTQLALLRAGFHPKGGGELKATVSGWQPRGALVLEERGALLEVRGLSIASRLKGDVAERQRDAAQERLWEERRIETRWGNGVAALRVSRRLPSPRGGLRRRPGRIRPGRRARGCARNSRRQGRPPPSQVPRRRCGRRSPSGGSAGRADGSVAPGGDASRRTR